MFWENNKSSVKKEHKFFNEVQDVREESCQKVKMRDGKSDEEKEQLIFTLERANTYIDENYRNKYKEVVNNWDSMIEIQQ